MADPVPVPAEAVADAAGALAVHRWKSMGVASAECECGEILCGDESLTQFPADEAFRRHLAEAALGAAAEAIREADAERIENLKAALRRFENLEAAGQAKAAEMAVAAERERIASLLRDKAAKLAQRGTHGASAAGAVFTLADLIDGGDSD